MLQTIIELRHPPMPTRTHFSEVFVLRDLSVALSACIYQSLCDSDTFSVKQQQDGSVKNPTLFFFFCCCLKMTFVTI